MQNSFVLFLQKGYKEVSVNEIAKTCSISKGAFYYHYKSKDELYLEVLHRFFFSYFKSQDCDYGENSLEFKFMFLVSTFIEPYKEISSLLKQKDLSAYFRFLFQAVNYFPDIKYRVNKHFYIKGYYLYLIINDAKNRGEIKQSVDPKLMARQILSSIIGVTVLEGINDIDMIKLRLEEVIKGNLNLITI